MLFKETIGGQLSGSMGAVTASHGIGGPYFRIRAIPTNPGTPQQSTVRQVFGQLAKLWTTVLTQAQRDAWKTYADNVTLLNPLGDSINVTALNMYIRSNTPRLQNGLPRVDDGPVQFNTGDFTLPSITSLVNPFALTLAFTATDAWVSEDDAAMLIQGSRQKGVGIQFFKGPYRQYAIQLLGDNAAPPASPFVGVHPFSTAATNKAFLRISVTRADGRLSEDVRLETIVT